MIPTTRSFVPAPPGISEQAQLALNAHSTGPMQLLHPDLADTQAWLEHIAQLDSVIISQFPRDLPVTTQDTQIAGVHTFITRADDVQDVDTTPVYLDIHGGALAYCGGDTTRWMTAPMALNTGMITWAVDYRMPPLHPYPAGLDDCLAVYRALLDVREPADIFISGTSAGANLAAALTLRITDEGLPMPAGLLLLVPELDLTESGDTFQTLLGTSTMNTLMTVNQLYAGSYDLADPYLSPLFGNVTGFPPTFLQSGTRDLFLSNAIRMHRKLRSAHVDAELHVFEAMPHEGFGGAPEDLELTAEIRKFLDKHRRSPWKHLSPDVK